MAGSRVPSRVDQAALVLLALLVPADARAYLDPGSGSMILQALLAGVFSALFFFRNSLRRIRSSLGRLFHRDPPAGGPRG